VAIRDERRRGVELEMDRAAGALSGVLLGHASIIPTIALPLSRSAASSAHG
jgi:hypothetical protein